jgi:hypothetical protein
MHHQRPTRGGHDLLGGVVVLRDERVIGDQMHLEWHRVGPRVAERAERHCGVDEHRADHPIVSLREALRREHAERDPNHHERATTRRRDDTTVCDHVEPDPLSVSDAVVDGREALPVEQIGHDHMMPARLHRLDQHAQPVGPAERMMEQQHRRHNNTSAGGLPA